MKPVSVRQIQELCAETFKIPVEMMTAPGRRRKFARPRQAAMYLARQFTAKSLPQIGRVFKRDHTTVLHAIRAVEKRELEDRRFAALLLCLEERLGRPRPYMVDTSLPSVAEDTCFKCGVRSSIGCRHRANQHIVYLRRPVDNGENSQMLSKSRSEHDEEMAAQ